MSRLIHQGGDVDGRPGTEASTNGWPRAPTRCAGTRQADPSPSPACLARSPAPGGSGRCSRPSAAAAGVTGVPSRRPPAAGPSTKVPRSCCCSPTSTTRSATGCTAGSGSSPSRSAASCASSAEPRTDAHRRSSGHPGPTCVRTWTATRARCEHPRDTGVTQDVEIQQKLVRPATARKSRSERVSARNAWYRRRSARTPPTARVRRHPTGRPAPGGRRSRPGAGKVTQVPQSRVGVCSARRLCCRP